MSVYVDDLTLSGKKSFHASFWKELQQYVNLDPATDFGRVLGRDHVLQDGSLVLGSSDFADQCVALYQELRRKALKAARSPHLEDGSLSAEADAAKGQLSSVAALLVMKFMWLSRTSRPDITFAVKLLAKHIACWSSNDDSLVAGLVGYLSSTVNLAHHMVVLDPLSELHIALYCDADFTGDSAKSTSTFVKALEGKSSFALLSR